MNILGFKIKSRSGLEGIWTLTSAMLDSASWATRPIITPTAVAKQGQKIQGWTGFEQWSVL